MEIEPLNFQFHWHGSRPRWNLPLLSKFCFAHSRLFLLNLAQLPQLEFREFFCGIADIE